MKFKSIAARIFIYVIPAILATTLSFAILSYRVSSSQINDTINDKMYESLQAANLEIQLELYKNAVVAIDFARHAKNLSAESFSDAEAENFLTDGILSNENTYSGGIWFEPYAFFDDAYYFGPFLYIDGDGKINYVSDYGSDVDYFSEDWYAKGKNGGGELIWSKVYFDEVAEITMVTSTMPFFGGDGNFRGVGTSDMNLENIRAIVNNITVGDTGRAFILGSNGEYISFFDEDKSVEDLMQADSDPELAKLGRELVARSSGTTTMKIGGKTLKVYYRAMEDVNWKLAITIDEREITSSTFNSFVGMTVIPVIGLVVVIFGIILVTRYLRRIVNKVNSFADKAAAGDFSLRIEVTEADEFGFMERRLNIMIANMKRMSEHSSELLTLAEAASNSKSEFLSRMSHEMRTPMNAIIGMTQIAEASGDEARVRDCLAKIGGASKHLLALINDILDMSKIEANKLELASEEFDPRQTLMNVCDMIRFKAEEKGQKLALEIDGSAPRYVIGDELRFSQVITNLMGNAIKFTPESGDVTARMREEYKGNDYSVLRVDVIDTGVGMSEAQQARLFKSFEQGDGSISRRFGGTGLGLAISKRIVELMGGSIGVESEEGKGSAFSFTARFRRGSGDMLQAREKTREISAKRASQSFKGKNILLAEDVEINREIAGALLEDTGVSIDFVEDGIRAVDTFSAAPNKYDLILMDIQMPGMDGLEATRRIRESGLPRAKTIPIIAMTANALNEDIQKCGAAGMNDHLSKPIELGRLMSKLNNYFNRPADV